MSDGCGPKDEFMLPSGMKDSEQMGEVKRMRKVIMFLGILLTTIILLSGSAVAGWHYGHSIYDYNNVTFRYNILGKPDGSHATLGQNPSSLGYIVIDLGAGNGVQPDTEFWVYASFGGQTEDYDVAMSEDMIAIVGIGSGDDSGHEDFTSPSVGSSWRYIILSGSSGSTSPTDPIYGPEIDAVGWYEP